MVDEVSLRGLLWRMMRKSPIVVWKSRGSQGLGEVVAMNVIFLSLNEKEDLRVLVCRGKENRYKCLF